jgi:hypothetical protein
MKFVPERPFADPDAAARKLVEIGTAVSISSLSTHLFSTRAAALTNTVQVSNTR